MPTLPNIIFKYAYPLDMNRRGLFEVKDLGEYPSKEEVLGEVKTWKEIWGKYNKDNAVIRKIVELTGVVYPRDIEVYVIGGGINPMSTPLILPVKRRGDFSWTEEKRFEVITHEILHRFVGEQGQRTRT